MIKLARYLLTIVEMHKKNPLLAWFFVGTFVTSDIRYIWTKRACTLRVQLAQSKELKYNTHRAVLGFWTPDSSIKRAPCSLENPTSIITKEIHLRCATLSEKEHGKTVFVSKLIPNQTKSHNCASPAQACQFCVFSWFLNLPVQIYVIDECRYCSIRCSWLDKKSMVNIKTCNGMFLHLHTSWFEYKSSRGSSYCWQLLRMSHKIPEC